MQKISHCIKCAFAAQVLLTAVVLPAFADEAQGRALTVAYNASGNDLFKAFTAKPGNIVLSPYSIGTAMAMLLSGARGETETEMIAVLGHRLSRAEIGAANSGVLATLNGYGESSAGADNAPRLRIANALMLTRAGRHVVAPDYIALVKDKFDGVVFRDAGLAEVNGWVRKRTEGKIERLFDSLAPKTALVLVNAVYFKAAWKTKFSKSATADKDFHLSASETARVRTMHQQGRFAVTKRPDYRAIRLPYSVESLSLVILLPNAIDGASALARRLDTAEVEGVLAELATKHPVKVDLAMPRFKAAFKTSLVPAFRQMGMKRPFASALADFSGIGGGSDVGEISHAAMIEVDEEGTVAAAATGVSVRHHSAPRLERFWIDRPFLFYLADTGTGAILFQGLVSDPR
jgi:leukocyte elastase inhibitor